LPCARAREANVDSEKEKRNDIDHTGPREEHETTASECDVAIRSYAAGSKEQAVLAGGRSSKVAECSAAGESGES